MFVDLDWPLNASSLLSALAELLVPIAAFNTKCDKWLTNLGLFLHSSLRAKCEKRFVFRFPHRSQLWKMRKTVNGKRARTGSFFVFSMCDLYLAIFMPSPAFLFFASYQGHYIIKGQETPRILPPSLRWLPVWRVDRGAVRRRRSDTNTCTTAHHWLRVN